MNNKWIRVTLIALLSLVVIAGVGFAGFRLGVSQSAQMADMMPFMFSHHAQGYGFGGDGFGMTGNFDHHRGIRFSGIFRPVFGLIHLAFWGGLIWLGYSLIKKNGWRLVKVNSEPASTSEAGEKKDLA